MPRHPSVRPVWALDAAAQTNMRPAAGTPLSPQARRCRVAEPLRRVP